METTTLKVYAYLGSTWTEITSDVFGRVSANWGFSSTSQFDFVAKTGALSFTLRNQTGKYTPGGTGVISSDWKKGVKVKVVFQYQDRNRVRFVGKVTAMRIDAGTKGNRKVYVTAADWMKEAADYPIDNPPVQQDITADTAINYLLAEMPIRPTATSLETGTNTFPIVFSNATIKTVAMSEFSKLATSELGRIFHTKTGEFGDTLKFTNSAHDAAATVASVNDATSPGFLLKEDGGYLLLETGDKIILEAATPVSAVVTNTMSEMKIDYGENQVNRIEVTANPIKVNDTPALIYELENPLYFTAGQTKSFRIQFTDQSSKRLIAALTPDLTSSKQALLHFDELDTSITPSQWRDEAGHVWEDYGADLEPTTKQVGTNSAYFDGASKYIQGTYSGDYELGTNDFTIEWWEYRFVNTAALSVVSRDGTVTYSPFVLGYSNTTQLLAYFTSNGSSWDIASGRVLGNIILNDWTHYAVCRSGNIWATFQDGVVIDGWYSSSAVYASSAAMHIGKYLTNYINACIDEFSFINGYSKYLINGIPQSFTPSTTPFTLSGAFLRGNTLESGGGTDVSSQFTMTADFGGNGADMTITKSGSAAYLTQLLAYSYPLESESPITKIVEDSTSITANGYYTKSISQTYKNDTTEGETFATSIIAVDKNPRMVITSVTMTANKSSSLMLFFLDLDVGDLVTISETQSEISGNYFIQNVSFNAIPQGSNNAIVEFTWMLREKVL